MKYEFHPNAEAEFLESVGFYESKVKGLGSAFIDEFEVIAKLVCESPKQRKIERKPDIRRAPLRRFPFLQRNAKKTAIITTPVNAALASKS